MRELAKLRSVSQRTAEGATGAAVLAAVARGLALPDEDCPTLPPRPEKHLAPVALTDLLKVLLTFKSEQTGVARKLIASAADLERIARGETNGVTGAAGLARELFGDAALDLVHGRLALSVEHGELRLLACDDARESAQEPVQPPAAAERQ